MVAHRIFLFALLLLLTPAAWSQSVKTAAPYYPDAVWQHTTPSEAGVDPQRLKERREHLSLTQKQVAERVGTQQPYISQLERGKWKNAPDDIYVRVAEMYGMPLSQFLKG